MMLVLIIFAWEAAAALPEVPTVLGYHAAVYDEGGNAIGDGEWVAVFRITDADGQALYEERQTVTAVGGQVSALIGNGLTEDNAPTGGVPYEALVPQGPRYLEVAFEGMEPLPAMELAAVPYAGFARVALGAAEGAIAFEALADGAVDRIAEELTDGGSKAEIVLRSELDTLYSDASAAATIGVETTGFVTSSESDLQGLLSDIDAVLVQQATDLSSVQATLDAERQSRLSADAAEGSARAAADAALSLTDDALDKRIAAVESGERLSFLHSAWGTVSGGSTPSMTGANASVSRVGSSTYRLALSPAMANASYAVTVTPSDNAKTGSPDAGGAVRIFNKTPDGFDVQFVGLANESFDFIVLGM
jgi:hypothetical protein